MQKMRLRILILQLIAKIYKRKILKCVEYTTCSVRALKLAQRVCRKRVRRGVTAERVRACRRQENEQDDRCGAERILLTSAA